MSQEAATKKQTDPVLELEHTPLGPLSDLERGIQGLKKLYEERAFVESKLAEVQAMLMTRETELARRDSELTESRKAVEQSTAELNELRQQLERQQEELTQAASDLGTLRSEFETRTKEQADAEAKRQAESEKTKSLASELDSFATELNTLQSELEQEKAKLQEQREAMIKTAEAIKQREAELAEHEAKVVDLTEREKLLREERAELERQRREIAQANCESDGEASRRLQAEIDASEQLRRDMESIARRCAAQEEVLGEYEQILAVERTHIHKLTSSIQQADARPEQIESSIAELKQCLAKEVENRSSLERKASELAAQLQRALAEEGTATELGSRVPDAGMSALRRSRLKRCRTILREQVAKVRRASEVLAKRFEQCEQVLSQRAQLSAVKRQLDIASASLARRTAAKKTGAIMLYAVLTVSILGALSWAVVNQAMPGTFAAKAELVADGRGRDLSDAEYDEWKRALEATLSEPQFIDVVADRMKKRGYESLATPGAVRSLFTNSLAHESPSPGTITLEIRAPGAEKAARSLDVIATALASDANAARERRADGAVTLIKSAAVAGARPIDDQRLLHAGILLVGATTLTLGLGTLVWSRLSKAKEDFEVGSQIDNVLDDAKWAEFTAATTTQRPRSE